MSTPREFSRSFSIEDQRAFAKLSGDSNPLHIDPVAARRLMFGQVAVTEYIFFSGPWIA